VFYVGQVVYRKSEGQWPPPSYHGPGAVPRKPRLLLVVGVDGGDVRCRRPEPGAAEEVIPAAELVAVR
jgi:hypothetical protein